jgi:SMC interacting uncharacterized protein involved in chromosome segregation
MSAYPNTYGGSLENYNNILNNISISEDELFQINPEDELNINLERLNRIYGELSEMIDQSFDDGDVNDLRRKIYLKGFLTNAFSVGIQEVYLTAGYVFMGRRNRAPEDIIELVDNLRESGELMMERSGLNQQNQQNNEEIPPPPLLNSVEELLDIANRNIFPPAA